MTYDIKCGWKDGKLGLCFGLDKVAHIGQGAGLRKVLNIDPVAKDFLITFINYKVTGTEYQLNYCPFCGGDLKRPEEMKEDNK
ncbi:MAG TPA: hypothetical protein VFD03_05900 [Clostridia bacterium]|nr:hypothetical protein [Clostridia bacterium]